MSPNTRQDFRPGSSPGTGWLSPHTSAGLPPFAIRHLSFRRPAAFSLIEILVVVGLLSVIILGLLLMFNQTQRAFRTGLTQVDVLEGGRAATELIARELSQMSPAYRSNGVNFFALIPPVEPLAQRLPGVAADGQWRTNPLQEIFFLTRENQTWNGIGYRVSDVNAGMGTLYRYAVSNRFPFGTTFQTLDPAVLFTNYNLQTLDIANMSPVLGGVVTFKVRAYNTNGFWITGNLKPDASNTDIRWYQPNSPPPRSQDSWVPGEVGYYRFEYDAVPAFVEFELGVLEERTRQRVESLPATPASIRRNYLADQASKVHVFRLRVPIRNVDPTAYQ